MNPIPKGRVNELAPNYRGRETSSELDKQPLISRNNNLNLINAGMYDEKNKRPLPVSNLNTFNLQKSQFDAMGQLRKGFQDFREYHQELIR